MFSQHDSGQIRPTKVLILIHSLEIGGAETDLVRVLPLLDRDRFSVTVCTVQKRGVLAGALCEADIEVIGPLSEKRCASRSLDLVLRGISGLGRLVALAFPASSLSRLLQVGSRYLRLSRPIARILDEAGFDVLHTMSPSDYVIGALANGFSKRQRLIMSRLSLNFYQHDARLFAIVERLLHRRVDLAVGNAQAILRELKTEGIPADKLMLVRNGIDSAKFIHSMIDWHEARSRLEIPRDALVFTSVANLFPYKGHADLLQALHMLRDRLAGDWALIVAGRDINGSLGTLHRLAEQLGLSAHVRFLGERWDIPHILSGADIHVSASHHEGFPNNLLEAMCAGLPVVATAVGGVPELVMDGVTGLLVPPKDPRLLAGALLSLADDLSQRESFGAAGRERVVQHFSIRNSVAALQDAYLRAAKSGREPQVRHLENPAPGVGCTGSPGGGAPWVRTLPICRSPKGRENPGCRPS